MLKKLDFLSEEIGFEIHNSKIFKTYFGSFLTAIIMITSIILAFMFGKEIYERKNPKVSGSKFYHQDSKYVLGKDLPIFFMISNTFGRFIENYEQYFNPIAFKINRTNSVPEYSGEIYKKTEKCKMKHFQGLVGKIPDSEIEKLLAQPNFCFNFDSNAEIHNAFVYTNSSYISFYFRMCNETNPDANCAADLKELTKEVYIRTYFLNNYVDSQDHSNPVKYFVDVITQQVSRGFLKRNFIRFLKDQYISDNGWILENKVIQEFISFRDIKSEINNMSPSFPNDIYWITIESPQVSNYYVRNYMKVQDLFANIGGIMNAFVILSKILFSHYLRYKYTSEVSNNLISNYTDSSNKYFDAVANSSIFNGSKLEEVNLKKDNSLYKFEISKFKNKISDNISHSRINVSNSNVNRLFDNVELTSKIVNSNIIGNDLVDQYKQVNNLSEINIKSSKFENNTDNNYKDQSCIENTNKIKKISFDKSSVSSIVKKREIIVNKLNELNYFHYLGSDLRIGSNETKEFIKNVRNLTFAHLDFYRIIQI
jgi:hypothetical protein